MRSRFPALALTFGLLAAPLQAASDPAPAHIPALHGQTLTGVTVDLPAALQGKVGVLVLGFSQGSRDDVAAWGRRLAADYRDSTAVTYYELPMLAAVPKLLRGFVLNKLAESVPDRAKPRFVPITDHESEWKSAAGYTRGDDAYILLVDNTGTVRWRTEGAVTDIAFTQLKQHLAATVSH